MQAERLRMKIQLQNNPMSSISVVTKKDHKRKGQPQYQYNDAMDRDIELLEKFDTHSQSPLFHLQRVEQVFSPNDINLMKQLNDELQNSISEINHRNLYKLFPIAEQSEQKCQEKLPIFENQRLSKISEEYANLEPKMSKRNYKQNFGEYVRHQYELRKGKSNDQMKESDD